MSLPPSPSSSPSLQVETDTFCESCGYNLHGQIITRDERLGILICRCPECGKFHPAGHATAAAQPWLNRLANLILAAWVVFLLGSLFLSGYMLGAVQYAYLFWFTEVQQISGHGEMIARAGRASVGNAPAVWRRVAWEPRPDLIPSVQEAFDAQKRNQWVFLLATSVIVGFGSGVFVAACLWHLRSLRAYIFLTWPLIAGALVAAIWTMDPLTEGIRLWAIQRIAIFAAMQALCLYLGLRLGRPLARTVLRATVPPRPLQQLSFLWTIDRLPPPPAIPDPRR